MAGRCDFEDTIRAGERNRDTARLVANWCAHAHVEKFGGIGLIEAQTGLPIGHHGIACDHAPVGGMSCWELRDSVIDFYDRNCSTCEKRRPVRLPNIIEIIAERDRTRDQRRAHEAAAETKAAEEFRLRDEERDALRPALDAVNRTILDDVAAYDRDRTQENLGRLTGAARMAPERFQERLKSYLTSLAEGQPWFAEAGVLMLHAIGADRSVVARLALSLMAGDWSEPHLVDIVLDRVGEENADSVRLALPAIVDLASPDHENSFGQSPRHDERLLLSYWKRHSTVILDEVEGMLASRQRHKAEMAGRLLSVLQRTDPAAADPVARSLVSTYVRARLLIDDLKDEDDTLPYLLDALQGAFLSAPELLDRLLQEYSAGSDRMSAGRIYKVYARMLGWKRDDEPLLLAPHRIAMTRLVWAATTVNEPNVLQTIASTFHRLPDRLAPVVRCEVGAIVGAAFLLADRVAAIDAEARGRDQDMLSFMERRNRRSTLASLMSHLLEWTAEASVGHPAAMDNLLALMDTIPEDREELRGRSLAALQHLAEDVDGLRRFLPHLYHGLVGSSVMVRSLSATAVGELRYRARRNVPPLVFEAFCALLGDPYVAVHKAAANALIHSSIPEEYRGRVAAALMSIVQHYRTLSHEDNFLAKCVRLLAGMADDFGRASRGVRNYLIDVAMGLDPVFLQSEIGSLSHTLGIEPAFGKLAARMLPSMADRINRSDNGEALIQSLSPEAVRLHAAELREAAVSVAHDDLRLSLSVVETMSRSGANEEAVGLAAALIEAFEDNTHFRYRRLTIRLVLLGLQLERVAASGDRQARQRIRTEWEQASGELAAADREHRERDRRAGLPFAG